MSDDSAAEAGVYHVVDGLTLRELLQRVADGEDPEMVYIEFYANGARDEWKDEEEAD
jgi:hypothetical protein